MAGTRQKRYDALHLLGEGGMARVYLALERDAPFRRPVAIKRILPQFAEDAEFRQMFDREARVASRVQHPNVVSILDFGADDDGAFLVMDYVRGVSLKELLEDSERAGHRIPLVVSVRIFLEVARALEAIHGARDGGQPLGIVHRDVSPPNVLISWDGSVRLADFGVATAHDGNMKTEVGILKGKRSYMAPEQLRFEGATQRSDLFSLGVVFFESLSGERLYGGPEGPYRILNEPCPDILEFREVPNALADVLFALLAKEPAERLGSATELVRALELLHAELLLKGSGGMDVGAFVREVCAPRMDEESALFARLEREEGQPAEIAEGSEAAPDEPESAVVRRGDPLAGWPAHITVHISEESSLAIWWDEASCTVVTCIRSTVLDVRMARALVLAIDSLVVSLRRIGTPESQVYAIHDWSRVREISSEARSYLQEKARANLQDLHIAGQVLIADLSGVMKMAVSVMMMVFSMVMKSPTRCLASSRFAAELEGRGLRRGPSPLWMKRLERGLDRVDYASSKVPALID